MKNKYLLLFAVGILFCCVSMQAQMTVTIGPVKDNTLYEDISGRISNGAGEYFYVGKTNLDSIRRGLLKFDIASTVPSGATILEANLTLLMDQTTSGATAIELHTFTSDWGEGASKADENGGTGGGIGAIVQTNDATWLHTFYNNSLWNTEGGDFNATASAITSVDLMGSYNWTSMQLVADVQKMAR